MNDPAPVPALTYRAAAADATPVTHRAAFVAAGAVGAAKLVQDGSFWLMGGGGAWLRIASTNWLNALTVFLMFVDIAVGAALVVSAGAAFAGRPWARPVLRTGLVVWSAAIVVMGAAMVARLMGWGMPSPIPLSSPGWRAILSAINRVAGDVQPLVLPALLWWLVSPRRTPAGST